MGGEWLTGNSPVIHDQGPCFPTQWLQWFL